MKSYFSQVIITVATFLLLVVFSSTAFGQSDAGPKLLGSATYSMPAAVIDAEIDGTVVMAIHVDENGRPSRAALVIGPSWPCRTRPVGALEELSKTLAKTMMTLKFSPAVKNGKPVEKDIGVTMRLKNPRIKTEMPEKDAQAGKQIIGGVLNGRATRLVKPMYPADANARREGGAVRVQVLIDESGKVVRAGAISGAPALQHTSRQAACDSEFEPTTLAGKPVKVSGTITYSFVPRMD